jgi:hypothetical protein
MPMLHTNLEIYIFKAAFLQKLLKFCLKYSLN